MSNYKSKWQKFQETMIYIFHESYILVYLFDGWCFFWGCAAVYYFVFLNMIKFIKNL